IGNGTPVLGNISAINWSDGPYFLKTEVDPLGGTNYSINMVKEILSNPYALYSNKSDRANFANVAGKADSATYSAFASNSNYALNSRRSDSSLFSNNAAFSNLSKYSDTAEYARTSNVTLGTAYTAGRVITANNGAVHVAGRDGLLVSGTFNSGAIVDNYSSSTGNSKLFFNPQKGALRAGYIYSTNWNNDSIGRYSVGLGSNNKATGTASVALGDFSYALANYATAMGSSSTASGYVSTAMGGNTLALGEYSLATGYYSKASGNYSTAMGFETEATGTWSTAAGWRSKSVGSASVAMGISAIASGGTSVALGRFVEASGDYSVSIGEGTKATGDYSSAFGSNVSTDARRGSFIIGDYSPTSVGNRKSSTTNQFTTVFGGGYRMFTNSSATIGVNLNANGNSWSTISDSTKKENYLKADGKKVLSSIKNMRLGSWNYKGQDPGTYRHYGPMAQEFYANFGKDKFGTIGNDTSIASADIDGVMMIAIQELSKENDELKARLKALEEKLNRMIP
ncbi:MAG: tail fiber domain-containing protein, partial [Ferruginibacter sp.]